MGFISNVINTIKNIVAPPPKPSYVITLNPTPAGQSYDTSGNLVSTPGTPANPGLQGSPMFSGGYSGGGSSGGGSSGGGSSSSSSSGEPQYSVTSELIPAKQQPGVIVTDTNKGSVTTKILNGNVVGRDVSPSRGANPERLIELSQRPGGLVDRNRAYDTPPTFYNPSTGKEEFMGVVKPVEKKKGIEGFYQQLGNLRSSLYAEDLRTRNGDSWSDTFRSFGVFGRQIAVGFATDIVGSGIFVKDLFTKPGETIKNIPGGLKQTYEYFTSGEASKTINQEPGFVVGYLGGEAATFYASSKVTNLIGEGYGKVRTAMETSVNTEIPSEALKGIVEPFTRQRASVFLKDSKGNYILGLNSENMAISIGGGIEKGQTARMAALAELGQETGLKLSDISNFKFREKFVFPEETHYVFTANIKDLAELRASSDVKSFLSLSPRGAKGISGQTKFSPVAKLRYTPGAEGLPFRKVRGYELGIINKLEFGETPTWLSVTTKEGKFYLGTQSRYNIPFSETSKYLKEDVLNLAHGTQDPTLKRFYTFNKEFPIDVSKSQRGAAKGLYVQPPISIKTETFFQRKGFHLKQAAGENIDLFRGQGSLGGEGYFGLSYAGIGYDFQSEGIKFALRRPKRAFYTFQEVPKYPITPTAKTFSGMESELIIREGMIRTRGNPEKVFIGGRSLYVQPAEIVKNELVMKYFNGLGESADSGKILRNLRRETGIDYRSLNFRYVTPSEIVYKSIEVLRLSKSGAGSNFRRGKGSIFRQLKENPRKEPGAKYSLPGMPKPETEIKVPEMRESRTGVPSKTPGSGEPGYPLPKIPRVGFSRDSLRKYLPSFEKKKSKEKFFPQPKAYQPTLMAAALNIKAPKIPNSYIAGAGGVTQRPLINFRRKKRR